MLQQWPCLSRTQDTCRCRCSRHNTCRCSEQRRKQQLSSNNSNNSKTGRILPRSSPSLTFSRKTLGISVLRLHQFVDHLSSFNPTQDENNIEHWRKFIGDFFSPVGVMRQQLRNNEKNEYKQFEIPTNLLARYYFTLFESGIQTVQLTLEHPREKAMVNQGMMVECAKASFVYWFDNGCHVRFSACFLDHRLIFTACRSRSTPSDIQPESDD